MNMSFPERLKELRIKKKLSQLKLSKLISIHHTQIGRYERGEACPSADVLRKLADILEVSTDYLMEGTSEEAAKSHIYDRELLGQFKQIQDMKAKDKEVVKIFLDAFIKKQKMEEVLQV